MAPVVRYIRSGLCYKVATAVSATLSYAVADCEIVVVSNAVRNSDFM